jgi:hypothetical protein
MSKKEVEKLKNATQIAQNLVPFKTGYIITQCAKLAIYFAKS